MTSFKRFPVTVHYSDIVWKSAYLPAEIFQLCDASDTTRFKSLHSISLGLAMREFLTFVWAIPWWNYWNVYGHFHGAWTTFVSVSFFWQMVYFPQTPSGTIKKSSWILCLRSNRDISIAMLQRWFAMFVLRYCIWFTPNMSSGTVPKKSI